MKYLVFMCVVLFAKSASAEWVVYDPPTYVNYNPVTATTTYYKGGRTWKTYNVPEHMRRGVIGTFDFLYNGVTLPFRKPVYAPAYYYYYRTPYAYPVYTAPSYRLR